MRTSSGPKIDAIKDCAILYVAAIGGSGAARVVASNIHPMKVNQPEEISDLLLSSRMSCTERLRHGFARPCSRVRNVFSTLTNEE